MNSTLGEQDPCGVFESGRHFHFIADSVRDETSRSKVYRTIWRRRGAEARGEALRQRWPEELRAAPGYSRRPAVEPLGHEFHVFTPILKTQVAENFRCFRACRDNQFLVTRDSRPAQKPLPGEREPMDPKLRATPHTGVFHGLQPCSSALDESPAALSRVRTGRRADQRWPFLDP